MTNGSADVIAAGAQFITNTKPGDIFVVLTDGMIYEIDEIVSATQLKLKRAYAGATGDGLQYEIVPTASYLKTLATQVSDLIALYTKVPEDVAASASAASDSAKAAATSAATAVSSASDATAAKAAAATSETNAANSASAAAASKTAAATSEANAASSASAASSKSSAAAASAAAAASSETRAASSAAAAATSESNAAAALTGALKATSNLSDVADKVAARTNLDVPSIDALNSKVNKTGDVMSGGLALPWAQFSQGHASSDTTRSMIYNDPSTRNVVIRTGPSTAYKFTVLGADGVLNLPARPYFNGATPWDTGNLNPGAYAPLAGPTFTGSVYSSVRDNSGAGVFRTTGDNGTAFSEWNRTASTALQVDAPNNQAAYIGLRWTRWGERHLAAIAGYAGSSNASTPMIGFLIGGDGGPGFQFYPGGSGTYAGSWGAASDYRLKTNLAGISSNAALDRLLRLNPLEYDRVEKTLSGKRFAGFLAHEAQVDFPYLVRGVKDGTRTQPGDHGFPTTVPDYQSVDYIGFVPYLVAALKAVVIRIEALEAKATAATTSTTTTS